MCVCRVRRNVCSVSPCSPAAAIFAIPMFVPSANSVSSSSRRTRSRGRISRVASVDRSSVKVGAELVDERGRVRGLADRGVVRLAVRLEVEGQVGLGVAPATRALYPDLAGADSVAQAGEHAQLVRDPLHPPALVHDRRAPIRPDQPSRGTRSAGS
jgi:hypothetical protein